MSSLSDQLLNELSASDLAPRPPLPTLPPEIILKVFSHFSVARSSSSFLPRVRNGTLFSAALVNKAWSALSLEVLYGSLQVLWTKSTAQRLLAAFRSNPSLAGRVRHLDAHFADAPSWEADWSERKEALERSLDARARSPEDAQGAAAARKVSPDLDWQDDREMRQQGFSVFWMWVADLVGLVSLEASNFDRIMTKHLQNRIGPVFSSLRHISLANDAAFALAILRDVETLIVSISHFGYNPDLDASEYHLKNVTRIKVSWGWGWGHRARSTLDIFHELDPVKLIAVDIRLPDGAALESFTSILSQCTSLQSLIITTSAYDYAQWLKELDTPAFRMAVAQTTLVHLSISAWPTHTFLLSLPHTLRSLSVEHYVPGSERGEFGARLEDALGWRAHYLPALEVLAVRLSSDSAMNESRLETRLASVLGRARGFSFIAKASLSEFGGLPGQWNA